MSGLESKSFTTPDEKRAFADKGFAEMLTVGGHSVMRATFEPGWRWTEHLRPVAGTDTCESSHFLYVLAGRMHIAMNDGTEADIGPDDLVRIEPGHDAWVVGEAPCELIDFGASPAYAKPAD